MASKLTNIKNDASGEYDMSNTSYTEYSRNSDKNTPINIKNLEHTSLVKYLEAANNHTPQLIYLLKNLGHLTLSFDYDVFIPYIFHKNENVRYWATKNIGKSKSTKYLELFKSRFYEEKSTSVKREIVSAVGRMQSRDAIPFLIEVLGNNDPKIVSQSIRGLLIFKNEKQIDDMLIAMYNHENEMIRETIQREYFNSIKHTQKKQPHTEVYEYLKNVVVNSDVQDVLPLLQDESVHLTFTSPPYYNARDYSIYPSYEAYLNFLENVFKETYRVTKEGRYLIVNTSPVIVPRISRAHSSKRYPIPFDLHSILTKMGWEFIDDIVWMKPEYSVKNRVGGFQQHRKPLAYKPNSVTEYLMVYRKKTDKLIDWNIKQYSQDVVERSKVLGEFETTNVWKISPKSDKVHSAIFPEELCKRVIEYYSFAGDLVFDPFAGIGTLGRTAKKMNRYFFLTEKETTYFDYMKTLKGASKSAHETKFLNLEEFRGTIK